MERYRDDKATVLFPLLFAVMMSDLVLTILQQPAKYWALGFENCIEGNIIGEFLLKMHPLVFIYAFLIYLLITHVFITHSKPIYKFMAIFCLLIGHTPAAIGRLNTVLEISLFQNIPKDNISHESLTLSFDLIIALSLSYWFSKTLLKYIDTTKVNRSEKT